MISFRRLTRLNRQRCNDSFFPMEDWSPTDWATAMAGECGEACNLIKKMRRGDEIDVKDIGKELADIVIYADLLATRLGLNLEECVKDKFNEVSDRVNSPLKL